VKHVRREDNLGADTKKKYEQHLDKHVLPAFRGRKLSEVTTEAVDDFLSGVRKEEGGSLSYWTKVDLKNLLSSIFTKAHDWGYWKDRNPVEAATVGKKRWARERRILTDENTVVLFEVLPHVLQVILKTLDCTGMRISELLGLRWKHVNTDTGWLRIEERYYRGDIDVPKTEGSVREVPLGNLLEDYRRMKPAAADPEDHVFARTDASGEPLWDSGIRKTLPIPLPQQ
jgi:integrase